MTFGKLFSQVHPDIKVRENGTCVWLYIDGVNYYTFGMDWWNTEIKEQPEIVRCKDCKNRKEEWWNCPCRDWTDDDFFCASGKRKDGDNNG